MENPMLSICVPTYGHEKYIRQALDSILMQKTRYSYEVLVGEDASPDNTRVILKEYEQLYPGKFQMFYREKNMNNEAVTNSSDLKQRCRGKYIIILEGDDFWLDENKIERQIDFLETHPEYIAVSHNTLVVNDNSEPTGENYPECKNNEYSLRHWCRNILPSQLTTIMYRNIYIDQNINTSLLERNLIVGDWPLAFVLASCGKIYCIQERLSAYRHVTTHGTSFSANVKYDYNKWKDLYGACIEYAEQIGNPKAAIYAHVKYFRHLRPVLHAKIISWKQGMADIKSAHFTMVHFFVYMGLVLEEKMRRLQRKMYKFWGI